MAATIDSGTETLFSDDSPCELVGSPINYTVAEDSELQINESQSDLSARLGPPNIQPYSGVLDKNKYVIRPIAFKPTPASRFGDRYGSTPILTRPGSRLTLYGSNNELQHVGGISNYSLDRKLHSTCPSVPSSPPLAMSSLTSLPHKLINYDSLESVRKSPVSTLDSSLLNKNSYRLSGAGGGSLLDLTPSPSDSGVSELEAALRDRDSELAYLRQTMEHNEQVIFRVYQEKERCWERELRRMKSLHENRLKASAQKAIKLEQMLMMQTYQLQQDKKRLCAETTKANCHSERLKQEINLLKGRLEDTEWGLCQKTGEISLLKSQLKEFQNGQTTKGHELLQLRNDYREIRERLNNREGEIIDLKRSEIEKDNQIEKLKNQIKRLSLQSTTDVKLTMDTINNTNTPCINNNNNNIQNDMNNFNSINSTFTNFNIKDTTPLYNSLVSEENDHHHHHHHHHRNNNNNNDSNNTSSSSNKENDIDDYFNKESDEDVEVKSINSNLINHNCKEMDKLRDELVMRKRDFEKEKITWAQEKEKVLKYQRQLQMNYVQMYRKTRTLENEVENLKLELDRKDVTLLKTKSSNNTELNQTIEL